MYGATKEYFESWYCSINNGVESLVLIPALFIDIEGNPKAIVQVVTARRCDCFVYVGEDYGMEVADDGRRVLCIGACRFAPDYVRLQLENQEVTITGTFSFRRKVQSCRGRRRLSWYGRIMTGIFSCGSRVHSLYHIAEGELRIQSKEGLHRIWAHGACGYLEESSGQAFPANYFWTQASCLAEGLSGIMTLVCQRTCCEVMISYRGNAYHLAWYRGASVIKCTKQGLIIRQGGLTLTVRILKTGTLHQVRLPVAGSAGSTAIPKVGLSVSAAVRYRLCRKNQVIFDITCTNAGCSVR